MKRMSLVLVLLWWGILFGSVQAQGNVIALTDEATGVQYTVERYMTANFPVGMVFAPDGRMFYTEKTTGNVRVILADGTRQLEPVITFPVDSLQERGMLGITLDPNFATNGYIYIVHTRPGNTRDWATNELVRFRLEGNTGVDPQVLLSVPITTGALLHNGGNVHFDDEGYLFLSLGDYGDASFTEDLSVPQGKIHRFEVTDDGLKPAPGNPFGDDNSAYAYGLRNPFDFAFDPITGNLFSGDVGGDCDDELNLILPGFHYGYREGYTCIGKTAIGGLPHPYGLPLLSFTPVISPTALLFYTGDAFPAWQGNLFMCDWNFGTLRRIVLDERRTQITAVYEMDLGGEMCRIDLVQGLDGGLYFGSVGDFGGAFVRVLPAQ